jgi:hypothetical protein
VWESKKKNGLDAPLRGKTCAPHLFVDLIYYYETNISEALATFINGTIGDLGRDFLKSQE